MTPSEAHDSVYNVQGHDQMVVEVYNHLTNHGMPYRPVAIAGYGDSRKQHDYDHTNVECEKLFVSDGRMFFADIAVTSWTDLPFGVTGDRTQRHFHYLCLELKPTIYSAGAVLRQVKVQKSKIESWMSSERSERGLGGGNQWATVMPVFRKGDENIDLYARMIEPDDLYMIWDCHQRKLTRHNGATARSAA